MSPKKERTDLPREPRQKVARSGSVFTYLAILFAVAFLLLLLTYFMQHRANETAIDGLKTSLSSLESIDTLIEDNQSLREQIDVLKLRQEQLEGELEAAQSQNADLTEALSALTAERDDLLARLALLEEQLAQLVPEETEDSGTE